MAIRGWSTIGGADAADAGSRGGGALCSGSESSVTSTPQQLTSEFEFAYEEYKAGQYIHAFFDGLQNDEDSCVDKSDECDDEAEGGLCVADPDAMKEMGCDCTGAPPPTPVRWKFF